MESPNVKMNTSKPAHVDHDKRTRVLMKSGRGCRDNPATSDPAAILLHDLNLLKSSVADR